MAKPLDEIDRAFLAAIRGGESAQSYARRIGYSGKWAEWKSKEIRRKLGVTSMKEALAVSELTAEEIAEIRKLKKELEEAKRDLAAAKTPGQRASAREDVAEAKSDLDDELRRRGLTRADLDELQQKKEDDRIDARIAAREEARRLEAEAADADDDEADDEEEPEPKPRAKKEKPVVEEPPESTHFYDKPLWGRR
jgi:hypothetical protein